MVCWLTPSRSLRLCWLALISYNSQRMSQTLWVTSRAQCKQGAYHKTPDIGITCPICLFALRNMAQTKQNSVVWCSRKNLDCAFFKADSCYSFIYWEPVTPFSSWCRAVPYFPNDDSALKRTSKYRQEKIRKDLWMTAVKPLLQLVSDRLYG